MTLGFTFQGDSLSPSNSGPALGAPIGINIQGITTGGYASQSGSVPSVLGAPQSNVTQWVLIAAALATLYLALRSRR